MAETSGLRNRPPLRPLAARNCPKPDAHAVPNQCAVQAAPGGSLAQRLEEQFAQIDRQPGDTYAERLSVEIDPSSFTLERLEAERTREGKDDEPAYLLFECTHSDRPIPGFSKGDYLRTDRPRDPNPNS